MTGQEKTNVLRAIVQFSKMFKVLVLAAVLIVPLAGVSWARSSRDKGDGEQKAEKSQRAERSQARQARGVESRRTRSERQQQAPNTGHLRRENALELQPERKTPVRQEPKRNNAEPAVEKPNRPNIERRRPNPENPAPDPQPAPQVSQSRENVTNADTVRIHRRARLLRPDIASEIRVPMGVQKHNVERPERRNSDVGDTRGRERPSRNEIVERISQRRSNGETRRWDNDDSTIFRRERRDGESKRPVFVRSRRSTAVVDSGNERLDTIRFRHTSTRRISYEDHVVIRTGKYHFNHIYRDRHRHIGHRIIWPRFHFPIFYHWGRHVSVHYVYPFYHRRYIFVSLAGYWPDYDYARYYWYPTHSYWWYGYAPVAQEVGGDTYNYYTYNYYGRQADVTSADYSAGAADLPTVDHTTFADVREKLARQKAPGPAAQTDADTLFDEGVKAFEQGNYAESELKFAQAIALEPNDVILPFAYAQVMLAQGKYAQAADVLRIALQKSQPDKQGIYFPRGLYTDENTLMEQIDLLTTVAQNQPADGNLQLLLGYQLLGIGEAEKAIIPLRNARTDPANIAAATMLLDLAEQIKSGETQ